MSLLCSRWGDRSPSAPSFVRPAVPSRCESNSCFCVTGCTKKSCAMSVLEAYGHLWVESLCKTSAATLDPETNPGSTPGFTTTLGPRLHQFLQTRGNPTETSVCCTHRVAQFWRGVHTGCVTQPTLLGFGKGWGCGLGLGKGLGWGQG